MVWKNQRAENPNHSSFTSSYSTTAQLAVWYFEMFCAEYPEDRWRAKVMYDLAGAYETIGETALAGDVYEDFVQDYPDHELAADAASRLAEIRGAN